ncbi:SDR42E1 [Bugula neritina]|uniref:SDR42E1 n=1 Tax=Bugula neritina TaxID=10212 RepID=A0A7J7JQW2_BUGNE|nr:SDR42E1 [Bugula neritina]
MGGSDGQTLLLTGGSGYVASVILQKFCRKYKADSPNTKLPGMEKISRVVLVDKFASSINEDDFTVPVQSFQGDITDLDFLSKVFAGADVVYHLASYGMSGREQLHNEMIWKVNVEGTKNVIEACRQNNVKSLIFTSTFNVVFGGQRIEDGDETLPYFDSTERSWDNYGNSKAVAEKLVLQVNNTLTANGTTTISTCVLRLAGIYGPRERRHIPRVVKAMKQGMFLFTYGDNPIVEFVHVENVVQALVQAQYSLTHSNSVAAGKAYFISDGKPVNNFEFFRPLTEALDVPFPKISVPMWLVYFIGGFLFPSLSALFMVMVYLLCIASYM